MKGGRIYTLDRSVGGLFNTGEIYLYFYIAGAPIFLQYIYFVFYRKKDFQIYKQLYFVLCQEDMYIGITRVIKQLPTNRKYEEPIQISTTAHGQTLVLMSKCTPSWANAQAHCQMQALMGKSHDLMGNYTCSWVSARADGQTAQAHG